MLIIQYVHVVGKLDWLVSSVLTSLEKETKGKELFDRNKLHTISVDSAFRKLWETILWVEMSDDQSWQMHERQIVALNFSFYIVYKVVNRL